MNRPLFTCAIICYNYGRYLTKAIESCFAQDIEKEKFEVLIIDDGSTDETVEVCSRYRGCVRVSRTSNLGFSKSLDRALREARGEYVSFLDADDWWEPQKLRTLLPAIENGALMVMHPLLEVDASGAPLGSIGGCGNTSSLTVHRDTALTLLPGETELFVHPIADLGYGATIHQCLGNYRIHASSMTDRGANGKQAALMVRTATLVAERLEALGVAPPDWEPSADKFRKISLRYRAEASTKQFELVTELRSHDQYLVQIVRMYVTWLRSGRLPEKRHFRLTARALLQLIRLN